MIRKPQHVKDDDPMLEDGDVFAEAPLQPAASVPAVEPPIAPELRERLDTSRLQEYPPAMIARHAARYQWAVDRLRERFPHGAKGVMDFGCGSGFGTRMLLSAAKAVVGVDNSHAAIRQAARYCASGCAAFELGSEARLPRPAVLNAGLTAYDAVVAVEVIEHVDDPATLLREAYRLTRPSGCLLVTTPERPAGKPASWTPANPHHKREYSLPEFRSLVETAVPGPEGRRWHVTSVDSGRIPGFLLLEAEAGR